MEYTPLQLSEKRRKLALEYNANMKRIGELKQNKAFEIIKLLAEHKTASKSELFYNVTKDGQEMLKLEMCSKGLLELMRSIKTEVDIKNNEAFGQY